MLPPGRARFFCGDPPRIFLAELFPHKPLLLHGCGFFRLLSKTVSVLRVQSGNFCNQLLLERLQIFRKHVQGLNQLLQFFLSFQWLGRRYGLFQLPPRFSGGLQFFRYSSGVLVAPTILA